MLCQFIPIQACTEMVMPNVFYWLIYANVMLIYSLTVLYRDGYAYVF